MLMPLQGTFPGWPAAPQRSIVDFLIVLVAIPLVVSAVITLLAMAGSLGRRAQAGTVRQKEPVWLGSTASSKAITADNTKSETGGASVRW
ncbi:hypothetical protein [Mariniluteicoccus flavus]